MSKSTHLQPGDRDMVRIGNWPYLITRDGEIFSERSGRMLAGGVTSTGYRAAILSHRGDKMKVTHHLLVAEAFLGPRYEGLVVNHKNGNKSDNRAENLEYCTPAENREHAKIMGLYPSGERCSWAKLSRESVAEIRALSADGVGVRQIARRFGVDKKAVQNILKGKTWRSA